jgi:hypothetical protein
MLTYHVSILKRAFSKIEPASFTGLLSENPEFLELWDNMIDTLDELEKKY